MINDRIKEVRKSARLTQQTFAEKIGVKQQTVAMLESGRNQPSDQTVFVVCREFRVNETWLRTGEGEMFLPTPQDELDKLCEKYGLDDVARTLIEKFIALPDEDRKVVLEYVQSVADGINAKTEQEKAHEELDRQFEKRDAAAARCEA